MIAEILPEVYDGVGRKTFRPDARRHSGFKPTFPAGRFLSHPLKYWCSDFNELRQFLGTCKYISDKEQFGRRDYWQPPEDFEQTRTGDCEDFALWTWRQLLHMGYASRFVVGSAGRYGTGHAWVTFEKDGKTYVLEPLARFAGVTLPHLSIVRYKPEFSMSWDGKAITYYQHENRRFSASGLNLLRLLGEWLFYWASFWLRLFPKLVIGMGRRVLGEQRASSTGKIP